MASCIGQYVTPDVPYTVQPSPHREASPEITAAFEAKKDHEALFDGANPFDEAEGAEPVSAARANRPAVVKDRLEAEEAQDSGEEGA